MHIGHDTHHGFGHNGHGPSRTTQWQTPHLTDQPPRAAQEQEPDLDLVEAAFADSFAVATDRTSFLRLAHVPFVGVAHDGTPLSLLRVEIDDVTDMGSLVPVLGGGKFRYDPLPAKMTSRRRRVRFIYFDGKSLVSLSLAEATALSPPPESSAETAPE